MMIIRLLLLLLFEFLGLTGGVLVVEVFVVVVFIVEVEVEGCVWVSKHWVLGILRVKPGLVVLVMIELGVPRKVWF